MVTWGMSSLGDCCNFFNGKAHEKAIAENGEFVVINSKFISTVGTIKKFTNHQMFPLFENDVVMVMSDVPNGKALAKCYLIEKNNTYSLNQRICAIRSDKFLPKYLFYQLNRHKYLLGFNNGENQTNLRKGDILRTPLLVPPIPEQKRIVAKLDQAFEAIDQARANVERNLQNAKDLFQSQLNQIFSQKGEGWVERKLGEICDIVGGGTPSKKNKEYYDGTIPWATVRDMNVDLLVETEHKITKLGLDKSSANVIRAGNVIIATRVGLGKICLLGQDTAINQDLKGIIPKKKYEISEKFLFWWFKNTSDEIINAGTGATVQGVKIPFIQALDIPIPLLREQNDIVMQLDEINAQVNLLNLKYHHELNALGELKKSILQKAFNGEL